MGRILFRDGLSDDTYVLCREVVYVNHKDTVEAPNRLRAIQKRYTGTATPSNTYEVRADDLAWLINEVELRCARVDPPAAPTEARACSCCDHPTGFLPAVPEDGKWLHQGRDTVEVCTATPRKCEHCGKEKTSPECWNCGRFDTAPTIAPPTPDEADKVLAHEVLMSGNSRYIDPTLEDVFTAALAQARKEGAQGAWKEAMALLNEFGRDLRKADFLARLEAAAKGVGHKTDLAELDRVLAQARVEDPIGVRLTELALEHMDAEESAAKQER